MTRSHHILSRRRKFSTLLHRWHRRIGVLASFFVIWMVVSGWMLNHTATLDLAQRAIHSPLLARRYGLQVDMPQQAFDAKQHWLVQVQDGWLLDGKKIDTASTPPLGMAFANNIVFIAGSSQLLLLTADGATIDKLSGSLLPVARIEKIGSGCGGAVIEGDGVIERGEKSFVTADGTAWSECKGSVGWSTSQALTDSQKKNIAPIIQPGISLERLLLDLHSGRFFGSWGPYFIDTVGMGLMVLALSGLWMYALQSRRRRHLQH